MAYRGQRHGTDPFSTKTSRHERFAQMSQQEMLIEQKKKELMAKIAQSQKPEQVSSNVVVGLGNTASNKTSFDRRSSSSGTSDRGNRRSAQWRGYDPKWKNKDIKKETETNSSSDAQSSLNNVFLNDGSFMDQFKKIAEGKGTIEALKVKEEKVEKPTKRDSRDSRDSKSSRDSRDSRDSSSSDRMRRNSSRDSESNRNSQSESSRRGEHTVSRGFSQEAPPAQATARAPSPYSPSRMSPDSSPPRPSFSTSIPPPALLSVPPLTPNLSQPPPLTTPLLGTNLANVPPPMLTPHVMVHTSIPPPNVSTANNPIPPPMVNIPPPRMMTSQPPPNLITGMSIPPPNMATPPPALPSGMPPQFPFPLPTGPPPPVQLQPPVSSLSLPVPTSIPPPPITTYPVISAAPGPPGIVNEVSPAASSPLSSSSSSSGVSFTLTAAIAQLARMVAEGGDDIEEMARERNRDDPTMWFLYQKESGAYRQYRDLVERLRATNNPEQRNEIEVAALNVCMQMQVGEKRAGDLADGSMGMKKRRSRWGEQGTNTAIPPPQVINPCVDKPILLGVPMLSRVTRTDPKLLAYAQKSYGTTNLSEEDWVKCEDHYKVHLLYHDMLRKREQLAKLERAGKHKYEYDSDEETDGGTWEHKLRSAEMEATDRWAEELTKQAEGKHHIGDFLPPGELAKFMEKYEARKEGREPDLSDYKEYKLKEDNIGFKMLQKLGWSEGQGLGSEGQGITDPVNKAPTRSESQGLGLERPEEVGGNDDEYDAYRKRMMLAYRFRPNPLNNPRRSYY